MMSNGKIKLADFGTARMMKANEMFVVALVFDFHSTIAGSGFYMSPEMTKNLPNGKKTDTFSFGITICYLLGLTRVCPSSY